MKTQNSDLILSSSAEGTRLPLDLLTDASI